MRLETARKELLKQAAFLGLSFTALLEFCEEAPLAQNLRTIEAYRTYRELAYV